MDFLILPTQISRFDKIKNQNELTKYEKKTGDKKLSKSNFDSLGLLREERIQL